MRVLSMLLLATILGLIVAPAVEADDTVRIAVSVRNVVLMPYYFARDKGFFEREGLRAEIIQIRSNLQVAGVASGELDFMSGVGTAIDAAQKGAPLKVLAVLYRAPLFSWLAVRRSERRKNSKARKSTCRASLGEPQCGGMDAGAWRS